MPVTRRVLNASPYQLLIVEDHPLMRRMLRQLLENEPDLRVSWEAESVESALTQLGALEPDLILTDLSLPGATGLELVKDLKRSRPELRCLVVTGHVEGMYRAAALDAGAVGFAVKDDPDEIIGAVRQALGFAV